MDAVMTTYKAFRHKVLEHLKSFLPPGSKPGKFNGGEAHAHIVEIPGKTQREVIEAILKGDGVADVTRFPEPHRYAHHLNSSQVVCYEFFRPLLTLKNDDLVTIDEKMGPVLNAMHVPETLFREAKAEFEKKFDDEEGTNFDFYLESLDGKSRLYVEVKYTERGFGSCKDNPSHRKKFEDVYLGRIADSPCLNEKAKKMMQSRDDFPTMKKHYQLFRNALRVNENDYAICLYPKANTITDSQSENFKNEFISVEMSSHVLNVHWEDLKEHMNELFKEKFFEYANAWAADP